MPACARTRDQRQSKNQNPMTTRWGCTTVSLDTRVSPENLLWCGVPHYYGTNTRRRGPSRPGAHCPDSVELHGGNVPKEEGGVGGGQARAFGDMDQFTFERPGPSRPLNRQKDIVRP